MSPWLGGVPLSVMGFNSNLFSLRLGLISSTLLGPVLFLPEKGTFQGGGGGSMGLFIVQRLALKRRLSWGH